MISEREEYQFKDGGAVSFDLRPFPALLRRSRGEGGQLIHPFVKTSLERLICKYVTKTAINC